MPVDAQGALRINIYSGTKFGWLLTAPEVCRYETLESVLTFQVIPPPGEGESPREARDKTGVAPGTTQGVEGIPVVQSATCLIHQGTWVVTCVSGDTPTPPHGEGVKDV